MVPESNEDDIESAELEVDGIVVDETTDVGEDGILTLPVPTENTENVKVVLKTKPTPNNQPSQIPVGVKLHVCAPTSSE